MGKEEWMMEVIHPRDKIRVRNKARIIAKEIGFIKEKTIEEIVITVSELASNLIKHAKGGKIVINSLEEKGKKGIQIESIDKGPGIDDIELAMVDGFSKNSGLGFGLGTINRLMDSFKITSRKGFGTHIIVKRWIQEGFEKEIFPLDIGGVSKPYPGLKVNGDAFIIKRWKEKILISVIDGLGHGPMANSASNIALRYIKKNFDQSLNQIIRGVHMACQHSRGLVMALARLDLINKDIFFTGIGNIEVRIFGNKMQDSFISRRGIMGRNIPTPKIMKHHWEPGFIMILFSDGIKSRWQWKDYSYLLDKPARFIAYRMLEDLARDDDDATIVVVKEY